MITDLLLPVVGKQLLALVYPVGDALLNIFARTSESINQEKFSALGISWRKNIYRGSRSLIDWTLDASDENGDTRIVTGLTWRLLNRSINADASTNYFAERSRQGIESSHVEKRARLQLRNNLESLGRMNSSIEINDTQSQINAGLRSEISGDYGYGRVTFDHTRFEQSALSEDAPSSQNNYTLTSRFNFVAGGGELVLGGDRQSQSGVMINLESIKEAGLEFLVMVDNIERARVKAGSSTFVALPPYHSYKLSLTPQGDTLVKFDNSIRRFTLYPGNVEKLTWDIETVKVIVFQLFKNRSENFANGFAKKASSFMLEVMNLVGCSLKLLNHSN